MGFLLSEHQHSSVRFQIAKGQVDQLFLKWVSQPATEGLLKNLLQDVKSGTLSPALTHAPAPLFTKVHKQLGSPT